MKKALVLGAAGFIGGHMVKRLKEEGYFVVGVDIQKPEFRDVIEDIFIFADLRLEETWRDLKEYSFDEVYQFAADMGGAGYLFTGLHDADIMHNSALINLHVINEFKDKPHVRVFYSSSACVYPEYNQMDPSNPKCTEDSTYPAEPESEYGWEKLFSERMYLSAKRQYGMNVCIARFHTIYGPIGTWTGGKEKAPAALCRKVAQNDEMIEVWGDGEQTRSFLYVDDCIEAVRRLVASQATGPFNIGSEHLISINDLARLLMKIAGKEHLKIEHVEGPQGVRGRVSDNTLIHNELGWEPQVSLEEGMKRTYDWIYKQAYGN